MAIKKYTNFDGINTNSTNEGQFLQADDLFIVSKNEIEEADFGECRYDVMEVSIYDVNNLLLPNKTGNNVAYIKTGDIKNYMYNVTNAGGQKELAIDAEKLLNDLGFTNGILKINMNFVRYRVGSENDLERVWIHEISPSREEIRILPLKTKNTTINNKTNNEFSNLGNLRRDFKYYKKSILDSLNSFEGTFLESIDTALASKFGNDFFSVLKKDFGLSRFDNFRKKIYEDFKTSVTYYLNNKNYNIKESNFGQNSNIRFEACEQYDFEILTNEIQTILFQCIDANSSFLKRRNITVKSLPKEFAITEIRKEIKNNLEAFGTPTTIKRNVYNPQNVSAKFDDIVKTADTPPKFDVLPIDILPPPPREEPPIDIIKPLPVPEPPIVITPAEPVVIILPPPPREEPSPRRKPSVEVVELPPTESVDITPSYGGGGGGGGERGREFIDRNGYGYGGNDDNRGNDTQLQAFQ